MTPPPSASDKIRAAFRDIGEDIPPVWGFRLQEGPDWIHGKGVSPGARYLWLSVQMLMCEEASKVTFISLGAATNFDLTKEQAEPMLTELVEAGACEFHEDGGLAAVELFVAEGETRQ